MKVKIFQPNHNGKIEFTCAELEKLLNEIYSSGYQEGEAAGRSQSWTWTSPSIATQPYYTTTTPGVSNDKNIDKLAYDAIKEKAPGAITIANKIPAYTVPMGREDVDKLAQTINSLITGAKPNDVFTNLAKELNF